MELWPAAEQMDSSIEIHSSIGMVGIKYVKHKIVR